MTNHLTALIRTHITAQEEAAIQSPLLAKLRSEVSELMESETMGREIRRVPPDWEHPKDNKGNHKPLYDRVFDIEMNEWYKNYLLWKDGKHPDQEGHPDRTCSFSEWDGGPPDPEYHRPAWSEEPTWYQMYETVSEGCPVSPPFATQEELVDYLVEHGDYWDQNRGDGGWQRENAEQFVRDKYAPSMSFVNGVIYMARDGYPEQSVTPD